ncbi:hypothetical protein FHX42_003794 [Saccharopolyspora lacisalsi]|uniref:DUF4267 domain-containing protein n=1 Tax=Halosaccharopolyspora lacisalsi TaxID=1000566 RepID=A0A839E699_9PSEU|nr:hypothetical protein [Halosaccharopolyspora lacisalsi]MBA8826418.1 hypothetical protein [Halosaccharopolyspora lacisalsi]
MTPSATGDDLRTRSARCVAGLIGTGRVALGAAAVLRPPWAATPWVGAAQARSPAVRVLARAAGGRDIALGAGSLLALRRPRSARALPLWLAAAAVADATDVAATVSCWSELPRSGRSTVTALASGATLLSTLAAVALHESTSRR